MRHCLEKLNDVQRSIICKINAQQQNFGAQINELVQISTKNGYRHAYIYGSLFSPKRQNYCKQYQKIAFGEIFRAQVALRYLKNQTKFDMLDDWQRYIAIKLNFQEDEQSLNLYIDKLIRLNEDPQTKLSSQNIYVCIANKANIHKRIRDMNKNVKNFIPERPILKEPRIKQDPPKKNSRLWQMKNFIKRCFSEKRS